MYDIAVRWRQVADPYDPVFYFDGLSKHVFDEGLFLRTYLIFDEMRVNKYYSQFNRVFPLFKELAAEQLTLTREAKSRLLAAPTLLDVYHAAGNQDIRCRDYLCA